MWLAATCSWALEEQCGKLQLVEHWGRLELVHGHWKGITQYCTAAFLSRFWDNVARFFLLLLLLL